MQEAEQRVIRCQGDWSHSPCPLRASGAKPALWSAIWYDIYSHFHRLWVASHPNATWEFLGIISSWLYQYSTSVVKIGWFHDASYLHKWKSHTWKIRFLFWGGVPGLCVGEAIWPSTPVHVQPFRHPLIIRHMNHAHISRFVVRFIAFITNRTPPYR